jgi:hypothetical protein
VGIDPLTATFQPLVRFGSFGRRGALDKVAEYRVHAAECRALAQKAIDPAIEEALLRAAKSWDMLAEQRSVMMTRRQKPE